MKKYICLIICAALVSASCSHVMDDFKKDSSGNQTPYTVEHWQQNISDDDYTLVSADTQNLTGTTGAPLAYGDSSAANTYTGFTYSAALTSINGTVSTTGAIAADGSTVVKLYYNRNIITLTFDLAGGTTSTIFTATTSSGGTLSGKYGAAVSIENPTKTGYTFSAWNPVLPATFPAADASYTASWKTKNTMTLSFISGDVSVSVSGSTCTATPPDTGTYTDKWYFNGSEQSSTTSTCTIDTTGLTPGYYELVVTATDAEGVIRSAQYTVTVERRGGTAV